jgi:hypothetical protein
VIRCVQCSIAWPSGLVLAAAMVHQPYSAKRGEHHLIRNLVEICIRFGIFRQ